MRTAIVAFLFFLLFPISSQALDLDAVNLYPNIIKSLQNQEEGWFLHGNDLIFANPSDVKELKELSYPDNDIRSIVVMSFNLFYNGGYISMEKPLKEYPPDKYEKKILHEIKILTMERLYKEGIRRRTGVKKTKPAPEPMKEEIKPDDSGMIKIEATGKKL